MSVTIFTAEFHERGRVLCGSVFWEKDAPNILKATVGYKGADGIVEAPLWRSELAGHIASDEKIMANRMMRVARNNNWAPVFTAFTKYARTKNAS